MTTNDYQATVAAYAEELRSLFAPEPAESRSAKPGAALADTLADRAESLAERSAELLDQTTAFLADDDPNVRLGAEQSLLAQAAASLRVAEGLMAAEAAEEEVETRSAAAQAEPAGFDDLLALLETPLELTGGDVAVTAALTRGRAPVASRDELVAAANDAIDQVLGGVGAFGKDTLAGLLGLDTALLKQAARLVSGELAELAAKLGQQVSRLTAKAVTFLLQAYDSLLAALGQDATSALRQQAAAWIEQLQAGEGMSQFIGAALQADLVRDQVAEMVAASQQPAETLGATQASVEALPGSFTGRTKLAGQILAGIALLKRIPAARLPMVELATAAVYIGLLGFVVYTGSDYVDAPRLERIGRVPGVLHVVEMGLA
ncbi:MAG TPA: hypothetical protein PKM78_14245 [Anaerolineae bacterium]|nr:hypothetical protein [Anaerolineae bacterium]HNU04905.1 hypothetical protein [Anaerolineae bacterium]